MKKIFIKYSIALSIGMLLSSSTHAQHNGELYNNGAILTVDNNAVISVWGDMHNMGTSAHLRNNGLIEVQGNLYSDTRFRQDGIGTLRMENNDVNSAERQFISGSYAVRGGTAQIGTGSDGSFYNLELANTQGYVYLFGVGNIADVRNSVDFQPIGASGTPPANLLVTSNIGATGAITYPANGANYLATFGMMNPATGNANFRNSSIDLGGGAPVGNMSAVDQGYVIGNLRRAVSSTGGEYGYILGLEPAGAAAARGFQYIHLDFGANNYDVVTGYFQQGSDNTIPGFVNDCGGYDINYYGGTDHGEWVFEDIQGTGTGDYEVKIWPQDHTAPPQTVWMITKDNSVLGTIGDCGPNLTGLDRASFNGFSEFGFAGSSVFVPIELLSLDATPIQNKYIRVDWSTAKEENVDYYEIYRSVDGINFEQIGTQSAVGNSVVQQDYRYDDFGVVQGITYYYKIKTIDEDGSFDFTHIVAANLKGTKAVEKVNIYPNPVEGEIVNLEITSIYERNTDIRIYDAIGQLMYERNIEVIEGLNLLQINTNEWPGGAYVVQIISADRTITKEVIKIK
ncbi:MAG: T9SS type A sorting domain-containing protein [Aureispira sp.]|nr:T9SS type A sorting domain-containing protein [Aureispira sp.]